MKILFLESPAEKHEKEYYEMILEWEQAGEHVIPGAIRCMESGYMGLLEILKDYEAKETCSAHIVTSNTYFLINENNRILGAISIRHYLNDQLLKKGGHIGYGIRPSERKKGYGKEMLKMALEKCRSFDIDSVLITCDKSNIASAKTIIANNGVLENEIEEEDGNIVQRYWIEL